MSLDFESFIKSKQDAIIRAEENSKRYHDLYEQAIRENARENKIESYKTQEQNAEKTAKSIQAQIDLARPEIPSDIAERNRVRQTYAELIKENVSKENPLFFHGVSEFVRLEDILSSGHLGYLEDQDTSSHTTPGQVDVTTANSVATSINGFTGLHCDGTQKFLPAGCLIVVAPKDEQEKAYANQGEGTEHHISTVDFKENPERVVAIVSTTENKGRLTALAEKYDIDLGKIHTFDSFIEYLSQTKGRDFNKELQDSEVYQVASQIGIDISTYKASNEEQLKNAEAGIKHAIKKRQYENTEEQNAADMKKLDDKPKLQEEYKKIEKEERPNPEVEKEKTQQQGENKDKEAKEETASMGDLLRKLSGRPTKSDAFERKTTEISNPVKTVVKTLNTTAAVINRISNQGRP